MILEEMRVRPCWQGRAPKIIVSAKTTHVNSLSVLITAPFKIYFIHIMLLFVWIFFFFSYLSKVIH